MAESKKTESRHRIFNGAPRRTLTQTEFFRLCTMIDKYKAEIFKLHSVASVIEFIAKAMNEEDLDFPLCESTVSTAMKAVGATTSGKRPRAPGTSQKLEDKLDIIFRALGVLFDEWNLEMSPGLRHNVDMAHGRQTRSEGPVETQEDKPTS